VHCILLWRKFEYSVVAGTRIYHTQNSNHLDRNINLNKHKLRLLVNANTAERNVSQHKSKLSRNYPWWRYRDKRNYLRQRCRHEKPDCKPSFLNISEESRTSEVSKTFLPEGHISYYTTIRGPGILRIVIVSGYVRFYQINKFFLYMLILHYCQNGFAGRMNWFHWPDLGP